VMISIGLVLRGMYYRCLVGVVIFVWPRRGGCYFFYMRRCGVCGEIFLCVSGLT